MRRRVGMSVAVVLLVTGLLHTTQAAPPVVPSAVVASSSDTFAERLAAQEIRRYVYLRTGTLLPIVEEPAKTQDGLIVVGRRDRAAVQAVLSEPALKAAVNALGAEQYVVRTIQHEGRPVVLVAGGDAPGTLYGAYRLAEHLGVRFYLHGDELSDRPMPLAIPPINATGKPLFDRRGIQPFHDFPEGPDWWNEDGYKAILAQLPKLGMNFFGLHTYPEGRVGPEPLTWIGLPTDVRPNGQVASSYPSRHFTAQSGTWGYAAMKTSDYRHGAGELFDRDDYGVDYMRGMTPWPKTPEDCNELFDRMGGLLRSVFRFAGQLGIKTCLGTETPLVLPKAVQERLRAAGKNPADPAVVQEVYEGMFRRIMATHPLDYYWFWTPETWTWTAVKDEQIRSTMADLRAAMAAAEKVKTPFTLATCGWVLGPPQAPSLFDTVLPKEMPMSCINRMVGATPVEPGFAEVRGRPKWAIPWMEDDPAMISPQLWVGRMRKDAADARAYGCTGLLGIHWRTRVLGPNVSALAKAAWDQHAWNPADWPAAKGPSRSRDRYLPSADFYADWARVQFGDEVADAAAAIFTKIDGQLPRPSDWVNGPGGIKPDPRPWADVAKDYAFVDQLAQLEPKVQGAGSRERFLYWLDTFRYLRSSAQVNCTWARFNAAMAKVKAEKNPEAQKRLARELALPVRKELVAQVAEMHKHLLATVSTTGEMGNVTNWQQHNLPYLLTKPGEELARLLGEPLPADAMPSSQYPGEPRLVVPFVRTSLAADEPLRLTVIVLGAKPSDAGVYWRRLGPGPFAKVPLQHVARGVYQVTLPAEASKADFEYYVQATTAGGAKLSFPAAAPSLNQSVVVVDAK